MSEGAGCHKGHAEQNQHEGEQQASLCAQATSSNELAKELCRPFGAQGTWSSQDRTQDRSRARTHLLLVAAPQVTELLIQFLPQSPQLPVVELPETLHFARQRPKPLCSLLSLLPPQRQPG